MVLEPEVEPVFHDDSYESSGAIDWSLPAAASTTGLDPYYRSYLCRSRGCTVSQKTVRETMPAVVRQLPQFRGWPAADGAVFGESADID